MEDDLNVENLLETRAERAAQSETVWALHGRRNKEQLSLSVAVACAAALTAVAILLFSGRRRRRGHVIERY
jgi:hypothetical protein